MKYMKNQESLTSRYDAKVGHLFVGAQDNGGGWWNWWIALAEQGICAGEHAIVEQGGAPTLRVAKEQIATRCKLVARRILDDLRTRNDRTSARRSTTIPEEEQEP